MNILDKLKGLDQTKITLDSLKSRIEKAMVYYDEKENLSDSEKQIFERLYEQTEKHIQDNIEQEELEKQKAQIVEKKKQDEEKKRIEEEEKTKEEARIRAQIEEQEKLEKEKQKKIKDMIENLIIPHEQYLISNNKKKSNYSSELKSKMNGWNLIYKKLQKNPENETLKSSVLESSNKILKLLQDYDKSIADEENAKILAETKQKEEEAKRIAEEETERKKQEEEAAAIAKANEDAELKRKEEEKAAEEAKAKALAEEDEDFFGLW